MRATCARTSSTVMSRRLEHARGEALLLAEQAEQDVLGADVVVLEGARLVLREHDDLAGALGEPFEHPVPPFSVAPYCFGECQSPACQVVREGSPRSDSPV